MGAAAPSRERVKRLFRDKPYSMWSLVVLLLAPLIIAIWVPQALTVYVIYGIVLAIALVGILIGKLLGEWF